MLDTVSLLEKLLLAYSSAGAQAWEDNTYAVSEVLDAGFLDGVTLSALKARYNWRFGFSKYVQYDSTQGFLWLNFANKNRHFTTMLSSGLDLTNYSYVFDFKVIVDKYPVEGTNAFEFGFFPQPSHVTTGFFPLGLPYRSGHENMVSFDNHTAYGTTRLAMVHHKQDATATKKNYTLVGYPFISHALRRPIHVRWVITKSKIRLIVLGLGDNQGYLNPIRWCISLNPHFFFRAACGAGSAIFPFFVCMEDFKIYQIGASDYSGPPPPYASGSGWNPLVSYENTLSVVRNAYWWRSKVSGGTTKVRHGDDSSLVSFELDVTGLSFYDLWVTKYCGVKSNADFGGVGNYGGTAEFLTVDAGSLVSYEDALDKAETKYEMPQHRVYIPAGRNWEPKLSAGCTWSKSKGASNTSALVSFEDDIYTLGTYDNWEFRPVVQTAVGKGYAGICLYDVNPLVSHENSIFLWGSLGDMLWGPKYSVGCTVTITYG